MVVRTELTTGTFDPRNYKVVLSKIQNFAYLGNQLKTDHLQWATCEKYSLDFKKICSANKAY